MSKIPLHNPKINRPISLHTSGSFKPKQEHDNCGDYCQGMVRMLLYDGDDDDDDATPPELGFGGMIEFGETELNFSSLKRAS
ncbi:hypothetical protein HanXRQr2_Chr08g0324401 [Helianthus annuus]|uniref:Uncharacterized protein n=1 Tax=Helianthus annuus TaxID=4232 RepID=A0A9K3NBG1_HELAN|nr:hypothetical protein HanXRQr2_Chr08g0324401 [Helianthus annuus]